MFNIKQILLYISVGVIIVSCDDDSPVSSVYHPDADGMELLINEQVVYKELNGQYYVALDGDGLFNDTSETSALIPLSVNQELEIEARFIDGDGNPIEHEEDEDESLQFTIVDDHENIISIENHEEHDANCETLNQQDCVSNEHCEWDGNENSCEAQGHDNEGGEHNEHTHEFKFEIIAGSSPGDTEFYIEIVHDGHTGDYTSLLIKVNVTE